MRRIVLALANRSPPALVVVVIIIIRIISKTALMKRICYAIK